jgi:hypothetical protein
VNVILGQWNSQTIVGRHFKGMCYYERKTHTAQNFCVRVCVCMRVCEKKIYLWLIHYIFQTDFVIWLVDIPHTHTHACLSTPSLSAESHLFLTITLRGWGGDKHPQAIWSKSEWFTQSQALSKHYHLPLILSIITWLWFMSLVPHCDVIHQAIHTCVDIWWFLCYVIKPLQNIVMHDGSRTGSLTLEAMLGVSHVLTPEMITWGMM